MEKLATISAASLQILSASCDENPSLAGYSFSETEKAIAEGVSAFNAAISVHTTNVSWKLFNISSYGLQVLVSKGYEDGEQFPYTLRLQTNRDGYGSVVDEIGFDTRQEREEAFYSVDEDKALEFLKSKMFLHPIT